MVPEPDEFDRLADDGWTPLRGFLRGAAWGGVVAAGLALLFLPLGWYRPYLVIPATLRSGWAFVVAWVLLRVVQSAAGMVGRPLTALALGLTVLVLLSHHLVFAVHGVIALGGAGGWWMFPATLLEQLIDEEQGVLIGPNWFHPYTLLALNAVPLIIGGGVAALLYGGY